MADPDQLRRLALEMHGHADQLLSDCHSRPACFAHRLKAEVYRSLATDFAQRAIQAEQEVRT